MITEIDAGAPKDSSFGAHDQPSTTGVIVKGEAVGSSIVIDAVLRQRRNFSVAHERLHHVIVDAESFCDEVRIDDDGMIFDVYFDHLSISSSKEGPAIEWDESIAR
jgi:hypothetical protein